MSFDFDVSDELRVLLGKLQKKDRVRILTLNKKIREIVDNDPQSIDRYKNLKYGLSDYKRVHIDKSFVLLFKVDKNRNHILFYRLKHHSEVYKK